MPSERLLSPTNKQGRAFKLHINLPKRGTLRAQIPGLPGISGGSAILDVVCSLIRCLALTFFTCGRLHSCQCFPREKVLTLDLGDL